MSRQCIFITGAAAGIGKAVAQHFANQGWYVGLADIDFEGAQSLAAELGNSNAMALELNVCSLDQWNESLEKFWNQTKRLDVLVNNAGILVSGPFGEIPIESQHKLVDINIKGVMNGCYTALPYLKRTKKACVVNLSSASAIYGQPSLAIYSASKFAVRGLTEALNIEWAEFDIRVVDVMPLFVQTAMVTDMDAESIKKLGVKLVPNDVAAVIWQAATQKKRIPQVHWPVGFDTKLLYTVSGWLPDFVNRFANKVIGARH